MYHYCYRIDYDGGLYYIGKRSSVVSPEIDPYDGSGSSIKGLVGIKSILSLHESSEEAYDAERSLIGNRWKEDPLCLNEKPGGKGAPPGEDHHMFGKVGFIAVGQEHPCFGRHRTNEERGAISKARMGQNYGMVGENHPRFGYKFTEEERLRHSLVCRSETHPFQREHNSEIHNQNISKALTGKPKSEEHKAKLRKPKPAVVCRISDRKELCAAHLRYL